MKGFGFPEDKALCDLIKYADRKLYNTKRRQSGKLWDVQTHKYIEFDLNKFKFNHKCSEDKNSYFGKAIGGIFYYYCEFCKCAYELSECDD